MSSQIVCSKPLVEGGNGNFRSLKYPVALFLIVIAVSVTAFAVLDCSDEADADLVEIDGLLYELGSPDFYAATVAGYDYDKSPIDINIPSEVTYSDCPYSVTSIGQSAFQNYTKLVSVTIPDSVTFIGNGAFGNCTKLVSVTIGNSVTSIGNQAFSGCTSLASVTLNCPTVGSWFREMGSITSVTIGNSVKSIEDQAFYGCTSLASITVDGNNTAYSSKDGVLFNKAKSTLIQYPVGNTLTSYIIPDSVTSIRSSAFYGCTSLASIIVNENNTAYQSEDGVLFNKKKTILIQYPTGNIRTSYVIPDSVTSIGSYAFSGCTSLSSVAIGNSVTSIGEYAFRNCTSLSSVAIGKSVTSIGNDAFSRCTSLASVDLGSVTSIGNDAFRDCTSLASVDLGSVTSIGPSVFQGCTSLKSVTIPDSVTSIKSEAFRNCTSLASIVIPDSVTSIEDYAFDGCTSLVSVTIGDSVTSIEMRTFRNCTSLVFVTIGDSVTSIRYQAFYNCTSLVSVTIGNSVKSIGDQAFKDCYKLFEVINLSSLNIIRGSSDYGYVAHYAMNVFTSADQATVNVTGDGFVYGRSGGTYYLLGYIGTKTVLVLPNTIESSGYQIYRYAFYNCTSLASVTIPDSVTSIGDYAFSGCTSLASVTLNCPTVGSWFREMGSITSVTIGNSVKSIGESAFMGCTSLESLTIPISLDQVASAAQPAFSGCTNIKTVTFTQGTGAGCDYSSTYQYTPWYFSREKFTGVILSDGIKSIGECAFRDCTSLASVTIPGSVMSIGNDAFRNCTKFVSVTIPDSVKSIGNDAFRYCTKLASVTIGNSVTSIGNDAFNYCTKLVSVTFGNSVTSIGQGAFYKCTSIASVTIPDSVTSIGWSAFNGCTSLSSVAIGNSVTSIGEIAFMSCTSLESLTIPISLDQVASTDSPAFSGCTNIKTVTFTQGTGTGCDYSSTYQYTPWYFSREKFTGVILSDGIKSIGSYAFYKCTSIASVNIPDSVTSIGDPAFSGCTSLVSVTIGNSVTSIGFSAFRECTSLVSVTIGNSVKSIGQGAFNGCTSLASVNIPGSVTSIGEDAFYGCTSLTSIVIPDSVTSLGDYAFQPHTFYDTDGTTVLPKTAVSLRGYLYIGESVNKMIRQDGISIAFDRNGGTGSMDSQSAYRNIPVSLHQNTFTRNGYTFAGWNTESQGGGTAYDDGQTVILDQSITLYAQWDVVKCTVTIVVNDEEYGTVDKSSVTVDYGTEYSSAGNTLSVGTAAVTAEPAGQTAEYYYAFDSWSPSSGTVTGDIKITAVFVRYGIIAVPTANDLTYDGSVQTGVDGGTGYTIADNTGTDAGDYAATASLSSGYVWTDHSFSDKRIQWTIKARPISVGGRAVTNIYDGAVHGPTPADLSVSGLVSGHLVSQVSFGGCSSVKDVAGSGEYTILSVAIVNGSQQDVTSNYSVTYAGSTNTVTPRTQDLSWSGTSLVYNGQAQKPVATAGSLIEGDQCTVAVEGEQIHHSASMYTATAVGLSNSNYKLPSAVTQQFTIGQKEVSLSWSGTSLVYNGAIQTPVATAVGLVGGDSCTVTVTGGQKNAGSYAATAAGLSNSDYKLPSAVIQQFTIGQKEVALSWSKTDLVYNGRIQTPVATAGGLISGDACTVTVIGGQKNAGDHTATASALSNGNYKLPSAVTQQFTIGQKEVSLSWSGTSLVYNGQVQVPAATAGGLVPGDICAVTVIGGQMNAGDHTATASALGNGNYKLPSAVTQQFTIGQKEVTLSWSDTELTYDGTAQKPTATAGSLVPGDVCDVTVTGQQRNAGGYVATATELSDPNYALPSERTHRFTISPRQLSGITWGSPADLIYDKTAKIPSYAATAQDGVLDGDTVNVAASLTAGGDNVDAGTFTFTATGLDNGNYALPENTVSPVYVIVPKEVSLSWSGTSLVYNGRIQTPVATAGGLISGDACTVTVIGGQKNAGDHTATASALSNGNYKLPSAVTQQFTIGQKEVTVTADDASKVYGEQDPVLTATVDGTIGSDKVAYTIARESGEMPGQYAITVSGDASQGNYAVSFVPGTFTIEPLKFTVEFRVNEPDWGSVEVSPSGPATIVIEYGTPISVSGNTVTLGDYTITAVQSPKTEQYTYALRLWSGITGDTVTEDMTVTAVFAKTINTVPFAVNVPEQGSVTPDQLKDVPYGTIVEIDGNTLTINGVTVTAQAQDPTPQHTFRFDSWSGIPADHILTAPVTITAVFTQDTNVYTVSFAVNEPGWGSVGRDAVKNVPYGQKVAVDGNKLTVDGETVMAYPQVPTAQYTYAFGAWTDAPATVSANVTITAAFTRTVNEYTVSFDTAGGTPVPEVQKVPYGSQTVRPADPSKSDTKFAGWFHDNQEWDFGTAVTGDITLVARWESQTIVTFDVQGHGTAPESQTLDVGDPVEKPEDPQEQGFIFGGWFRESACINAWDFEKDKVAGSMTLYAKWLSAECCISQDRQVWTFCATLEDGLEKCSDGWYVKLLRTEEHSAVYIGKSVTIVFDGHTFYGSSTELTISADVTFEGMYQTSLSVTFAPGARLTTDLEFDLTASFTDVASQAGKVFVKGLESNDVAVAHHGYTASDSTDGLVLAKVTDLPFAVLDGTFSFYASIDEALKNHPGAARIYILNYIPLYEGGTQVLSHTDDASLDRDITFATVTRVTDGVHSSFYIGTEEIYNNGASIPLPEGRDMVSELEGRVYVPSGRVLSIADVSVFSDIVLGGGMTYSNADSPVGAVRLLENAPATRIVISFENIDKWIEKTQTESGWVYGLREGCDYLFVTSDKLSLNDLVSVNMPGIKANISPGGFSGTLTASQAVVAYVRTAQDSYTGYDSLQEAIAQATAPGAFDNTVYVLYRTVDREGDQPTVSHVVDADIAFNGTFRLATVHQHVDAYGRLSTYTVDDSVATLVFTNGHRLVVTQDADLSKVYVDGTVVIEGPHTVDLGGKWGSDRTLTMNLSAHEDGTVVKNAGDVQWNVTAYPGEGYTLSKEGQDLVLTAPGPVPPGPDPPGPGPEPEPSKGGISVIAIIGVVIALLAVAGITVCMKKR